MQQIIASAAPHLLELVSLAITAIIGWAAAAARRKWGIEIEARHREALHWALTTAAQLAVKNQLTGKSAVDLMLEYVRRSVPDAIGSLRPSAEVLTDLAQAKLEQVVADRAGVSPDDLLAKLNDAARRRS